MKTLAITMLILTLLLLPAIALAHSAGSGQAQEQVACEVDYTVQVNDWLSKLADKYYGDLFAYPAIVAATNAQTDEAYATIENPDLIEPGWTLCIPSAEDAMMLMGSSAGPAPDAGTASEGLSQEELANATYSSEFTQSGTATLTNGEYSEPAAPGSATETKVILTPYVAYGLMDGQEVAAVVLVTDPGGSGTFYALHLMAAENGQPVEIAATSLGDRIQINSMTVEDDQIVVDMVQAGPDDPMCCPSQQVIKTYELQGDQLVEVSSQEVTASEACVSGTIALPEGASPPEDAVVQVQVEDTSLADAPAVVMGEQIITGPGPGPIPYQVCYDPSQVQENHTYGMRVRITGADGKLLFINDTHIPVITRGGPTENVEVPVISVGG